MLFALKAPQNTAKNPYFKKTLDKYRPCVIILLCEGQKKKKGLL